MFHILLEAPSWQQLGDLFAFCFVCGFEEEGLFFQNAGSQLCFRLFPQQTAGNDLKDVMGKVWVGLMFRP